MSLPDFSPLSPQDVLEAAEAVTGRRMDGSLVAHSSYINRVYGLRAEDGTRIVAKFYRPGRWSEAALREEHAFTADCAAAGIPALRPLADGTGETLHAVAAELPGGEERLYWFQVAPFVSGRGWEPRSAEDWIDLGRLIARTHETGAAGSAPHRVRLGPETSASPALARLIAENVVHPEFRAEFEQLCAETIERAAPRFEAVRVHRVHGDLHRGNLLSLEDGEATRPLLIDFDDMAVAPAVQDLWLFLPGRLADSRAELNLLLEGYEEIRAFDRREIGLIEALRFMRMLGYLDWQAVQRRDASFLRAFPDWGSRAFWITELEDLRDQARVIAEAE